MQSRWIFADDLDPGFLGKINIIAQYSVRRRFYIGAVPFDKPGIHGILPDQSSVIACEFVQHVPAYVLGIDPGVYRQVPSGLALGAPVDQPDIQVLFLGVHPE